MKSTLFHYFKKATVLILAFQLCAAPTQKSSWDELKALKHDRLYTFIMRTGTCLSGSIRIVRQKALSINRLDLIVPKGAKPPRIEISKDELLYVTDGSDGLPTTLSNLTTLLYSAHNSWSDLGKLQSRGGPVGLQVRLSSGETISGNLEAASASNVTLRQRGDKRSFPKDQIEKIAYVRLRPPSGTSQYLAQEAPYTLVFDPEFWAFALKLGTAIRVNIYDVSKPEEETAVGCSVPISRPPETLIRPRFQNW